MRGRSSSRFGVLVAVGLVAAMVGLDAGPAEASHTGRPMLVQKSTDPRGGDSIVEFGEYDGQCSLDFTRWGYLQGIMQPPVPVVFTSVFNTPSGVLDGTNCPDTGEVVDLRGTGESYVVAGWSEGPPPGVGGNLMILKEGVFPPCHHPPPCYYDEPPLAEARVNVDGAERPSFIGGGQDFDGDGSVDVYEVDRASSTVITLLNQPDGTLVEGPMRLEGVPNGGIASSTDGLVFGDFDADGAMDLVADYQLSSDPTRPDGVAVVMDDGAHVQLLERDEDPTRWNVTVVDEDLDGNLDVRAERHGYDVQLFLGDGAGGFELASCFGWPATFVGTAGPDVIWGMDGPDVIVTFGGDDHISAHGGDDIVCAGDGNNVIDGGAGSDVLASGTGDDVVIGGDDGDYIIAGGGGDYVSAGLGDDVVHGGAGSDVLYGGAGADQLHGGSHDDHLSGGTGNDVLVGSRGDDHLIGGRHVDECIGGPGTNTFATCETTP